MTDSLVDRRPEVPPEELIAQLVPPPMFDEADFDTYLPDPNEPSQAAAVTAARDFVSRVGDIRKLAAKKPLFGLGRKKPVHGVGLYLDGGFGVGKTHLLASIFRHAPAPKAFGTFGEITNLVGALGFAEALRRLTAISVLCIDEFELDDPGDTMLISRLLTELSASGVSIATTSNTLPGQLGEGRFAAQDFLREIKKLAGIFQTVRVEGPDYRHRDLPPAPDPCPIAQLTRCAAEIPGATCDDFDELLAHLATVHPSRYRKLVAGVPAVFLSGVHPVADQALALRIVTLADRLYDAAIPVTVSGGKLDEIFPPDMLAGGYRKKYLRATSRLLALSRYEVSAQGPPPAKGSVCSP